MKDNNNIHDVSRQQSAVRSLPSMLSAVFSVTIKTTAIHRAITNFALTYVRAVHTFLGVTPDRSQFIPPIEMLVKH